MTYEKKLPLLLATLVLFGGCVWWVWSRVYIAIKRQESVFEIEKETHEKIKEKVKEQEE